MGVTWIRLYISMYKISVVWKHFKYKTNKINVNNTVDVNDIIACETKVVSLFATQGSNELIGKTEDSVWGRVAA